MLDALPLGPAIRLLNRVLFCDAQTSGLRGSAPGEPPPLLLHTYTPTPTHARTHAHDAHAHTHAHTHAQTTAPPARLAAASAIKAAAAAPAHADPLFDGCLVLGIDERSQ